MREVGAELDESRMIPVPATIDGDAESWARDRAESLRSTHGLDEQRTSAIGAALLAARHLAIRGRGQFFLLFDPLSKLAAPFHMVISEGELAPTAQRDFLLPTASRPPELRLTPETVFGVGCSSTFLTTRPGMAEIRWLFVATGVTLAATLAPVATAATMSMGITAEDLLGALNVEGGQLGSSAAFEPEVLIATMRDAQGRWLL